MILDSLYGFQRTAVFHSQAHDFFNSFISHLTLQSAALSPDMISWLMSRRKHVTACTRRGPLIVYIAIRNLHIGNLGKNTSLPNVMKPAGGSKLVSLFWWLLWEVTKPAWNLYFSRKKINITCDSLTRFIVLFEHSCDVKFFVCLFKRHDYSLKHGYCLFQIDWRSCFDPSAAKMGLGGRWNERMLLSGPGGVRCAAAVDRGGGNADIPCVQHSKSAIKLPRVEKHLDEMAALSLNLVVSYRVAAMNPHDGV